MFKRDDGCVSCPADPPKSTCKAGDTYSLTVRTCSECPQVICIPAKHSGTSAGAIAGGVIGGLVALGLIVGGFFWWRHRKQVQSGAFEPSMSPIMEKDMDGGRDTRAYSIDSVNTAQARGSNVIPIAYIPGVTAISDQQQPVRGSVATSDYRASLPDFVMAVHGQPSLIEIGALSRNGSGNSTRQPVPLVPVPEGSVPPPIGGRKQPVAMNYPTGSGGSYGSLEIDRTSGFNSLYEDYGLDEFSAPTGVDAYETTANSGKSMVTIPEDPEEDIGVARRAVTGAPRMRTFEPRRVPSNADRQDIYPSRQNSMAQARGINDRQSARYSRGSSVREYNMNIPEEAYLYYHNLEE